ncbi:TonB-dependent receptor [Flavobacteriaceae bacterium Ap0902]|nr:TonB-dependent receptor [Flavobacteriaceae bacterium Ap0902]
MKQILSIWCFCIAMIVQAQECERVISGVVLDFHSGEPISHADLHILNTEFRTTSGENGTFQFKGLCPDSYEIRVTHVNSDPEIYELAKDENEDIIIFLEHHIIDLEKIEVQGMQHETINSLKEKHIHDEDIQKNSAEAIGALLKNISGVEGLSTGSNIVKPIIHGMHSSRILMLNNGVKQEDMEWGVEHAPNMDVNNFSDIKLIKGGGALRYGGDAVGGVVLAEYHKLPQKDTLRGHVLLNGQSNGRGGNAVIRVQKGFHNDVAFQVQGSYKRMGDLETPDYILTNTASEHQSLMTELKWGDFKRNVRASYSYFNQDLGILKATHLGNLRDLYYAINASTPTPIEDFSYTIDKPYQNIIHHLAKIKAENRWSSFGKLELSYAFQFNNRKEFDLRLGENKNIPSMDTELTTHTSELVLTIDYLKNWEFITGLSGMYQYNFSNPETGVKRLIPDYDKYNLGAFASANFNLNTHWNLDAGLRYDYNQIKTQKFYKKDFWNLMNYDLDFSDNIVDSYADEWLTKFDLNFHTVSASAGVHFIPINATQFRLNYALNNRSPNPSELFSEGLHHSAVSIELGDVRIKPETSHKISLEYIQQLNLLEGFSFDILGYYNQINDYIYQIPTGARYTIRGAFPVYSYRQTQVKLYGIDVDTHLQLNPHLSWVNQLSYIHGEDTNHHVPLILMPPLQWKQNLNYEINSKWSPNIGINTEYTARQNRYPDYNFDISFLENGVQVTRELDLSSAPDAYFLVGLNAGIEIPNTLAKTQINLKVNNLFNQSYRNYLNRFRYYADELGKQIELQLIINF